MIISSKSNAQIKQIRSLRGRKEREETGLFFIEGIRLVGEAVERNAGIETGVVAPKLLTSDFGWKTVHALQRSGIPCLEVTPEVFKSISVKEGPQGIGAVVRQRWVALERVGLEDTLGWVALVAVQDPGNLGTIVRTADAAGASGLILIGHTADPYDPAATRASTGALFCQQLVRTGWPEFAAWKRAHGYRVVGTSDAAAVDYQAAPYQTPLILLMGSEQHGLSPEQQALADVMVRIPMVGCSDSLNLAVATGVMLYAIRGTAHA